MKGFLFARISLLLALRSQEGLERKGARQFIGQWVLGSQESVERKMGRPHKMTNSKTSNWQFLRTNEPSGLKRALSARWVAHSR
ncbi:hypothetical protein GQ44DRAFT_334716 [Phaeosphaeriaceae sp. PMI808]|nr:hypothetical protein GQ44DRAFT_334716 [Phaeosphaeriaceae sp. PMI808]